MKLYKFTFIHGEVHTTYILANNIEESISIFTKNCIDYDSNKVSIERIDYLTKEEEK